MLEFIRDLFVDKDKKMEDELPPGKVIVKQWNSGDSGSKFPYVTYPNGYIIIARFDDLVDHINHLKKWIDEDMEKLEDADQEIEC